MPPEDAKQPAAVARKAFVRWVGETLDAADRRDRERPDPGRAVVRRLNRGEYNRTVRDLVGVDSDFTGAVGMGDDAVGESFDNLSAALALSESLMEKYFAAADMVLDGLYATAGRKGQKPKAGRPPTAVRDGRISPAGQGANRPATRHARWSNVSPDPPTAGPWEPARSTAS